MRNTIRSGRARLWFVAFVCSLASVTVAQAQLKVTVDDAQVKVEAITVGGTAAVVGVEFEKPPWRWRIHPIAEVVTDDDGDGRVSVPLPSESGRAAIIVAADPVSGAEAVATWKVLGDEAPVVGSRWVDDEDDEEPVLLLSCSSAVVLAVSTDGQISSAVLFDGDGSDADGVEDGVISVRGEVLEPLGRSGVSGGGPWREGDRIYAIDLGRLGYARTEVPGVGVGAGGGVR